MEKDLSLLNETIKQYDRNSKEISERSTEYTKNNVLELFDSVMKNFLEGTDNSNVVKFTYDITYARGCSDADIQKIINQIFDIEYLKILCNKFGIVVCESIRRDNKIKYVIKFILIKELYEDGVYDFIDSNNPSAYTDSLTLKLRKNNN